MDERQSYANALSKPSYPADQPQEGYWWPQSSDLLMSKYYDTSYGSPYAGFMNPGNATVKKTPIENIIPWERRANAGDTSGPMVEYSTNTPADADRIRAEMIAAERSGLAKLGWDPGQHVTTPATPKTIPLNGMFDRGAGASWNREDIPNAAIHEAMHRGFLRLRNAGKLPRGTEGQEERYVRALMNKIYGDVELKRDTERYGYIDPKLKGGRELYQGRADRNLPLLDQIEAAAAAEVARKHPGGPR